MARTVIVSSLVSAIVSATLTLALVSWLVPGSRTSSPIQARRFEVIDENGRLKASLGGPPENDALIVLDSTGAERIRLGVLAERTAFLAMSDGTGRLRARIIVNQQGAGDLTLYGENERPIHHFAVPAFDTIPR